MSTPSDMHANGTSPSDPSDTSARSSNDPEAIRADIERTREDLAATVDELHAKLDVKTRAKDKVVAMKDSATTDAGTPRPEVIGAAVAAVLVLAGLVWWRRR
jgi:MYXO-CTERM domain-containing protein